MSNLPKWTPFVLTQQQHNRNLEAILEVAKRAGKTEAEMQQAVKTAMDAACYVNSRYQVMVRHFTHADMPPLVWLSIKRLDMAPVGDERFRDFQRIKNELVGAECEGIELYPAESRLADSANQYHLWCFSDQTRFPFGFNDRFVVKEETPGTRQKAFEDDEG